MRSRFCLSLRPSGSRQDLVSIWLHRLLSEPISPLRILRKDSQDLCVFLLRGPAKDLHRTDQAGRHQGRAGAVGSDIGEGDFACVGLLIAYQTIDPGVDDFDGEFVLAAFEGLGDVDSVGGVPDDAK